MHVLLVDDELLFLDIMQRFMDKRGIDFTGVPGGREAVEAVSRRDFDIVVLDVKMPGMDGIETLREIKRLKPDLEVIMLTGHANTEDALKALEIGAFDYLIKPVAFEELYAKIEEALAARPLS
ncbi:MAG: response regulator [Desulfovibrionaceae bacterium]|jgi:DNA-binding response OmpR family regulator|nr:response regulator [Desulfovibrionaceae bacterium]